MASYGVMLGQNIGKILLGSTFDMKGIVEEAIVFRTARRLMEGKVYYKKTLLLRLTKIM